MKLFKELQFTHPNLAEHFGSPAWFAQAFIFVALIGSSLALGLTQGTSGSKQTMAEATPKPVAIEAAEDMALKDVEPPATSETEAAVLESATDTVEATVEAPAEPAEQTSEQAVEAQPEGHIRQETVKSGDTMLETLVRAGADRFEAYNAVTAMAEHFNMRKLRAGQDIELRFDPETSKTLMAVRMQPDVEKAIIAARDEDGGFSGALEVIELTKVTARAAGRISDSLYMAMERAGVPHDVIVNQINIFSWDIDFQREIHPGDGFEVFFERYVDQHGQPVKNGHILYASMNVRGKMLELYRYTASDDGRSDYYHANGQSVRKALLRTPIDGARLTSRFGKRRHPILGYTKMHKGSDFGAKRGTPVKAAGDGTIERASRFGGYGKYVRIKHTDKFKTAYAHLHGYAKGIKKGVKVNQGQIIGYVGSTGRSTGPHLHYEVIKSGKHVNPSGLKLPTGRKLGGAQLTAFQAMIGERTIEIAEVPVTMQVAVGE